MSEAAEQFEKSAGRATEENSADTALAENIKPGTIKLVQQLARSIGGPDPLSPHSNRPGT
jgi:hypothetical protein